MAKTIYTMEVRMVEAAVNKKTKKAVLGFSEKILKTGLQLAVLRQGVRFIGGMVKAMTAYNASIEQATITTAGLIALNTKKNIGEAWGQSSILIQKFRQDAVESTATTKDFVEFSSQIAGPITRAGGSMKDLRDITTKGVIAARAFGIEGSVAARDIDQALLGMLTKKDRFARSLLEPMKITTTMWNKMVRESPRKAFTALKAAFQQSALTDMAKKQKESWGGVTSTLEDNLQRITGTGGKELTFGLKTIMMDVNRFLKKNGPEISNLVTDIFGAVVPVVRLMINGSKLLIEAMMFWQNVVANVIIQIHNAITIVSRFVAAVLINFKSLAVNMTNTFLTFVDKLVKVINKIPGVDIGVTHKLKLTDEERIQRGRAFDSITDGLMDTISGNKIVRRSIGELDGEGGDGSVKNSPAPNLNVNINSIQVASEDPDRFAFNLVSAFEEVLKNPTQAERTVLEV